MDSLVPQQYASVREGALYAEVEAYQWATDPEFQAGLVAILGPDTSSSTISQIEDLTLRARCFYYTRKYNIPVDFPSYKAWRGAQPPSALSSLAPTAENLPPPSSPDPSPRNAKTVDALAPVNTNGVDQTSPLSNAAQQETSSQPGPDYPASFAEVMELIKTGQPIPGIRDIPDTVLVGRGTEATLGKRRKPWEQRSADVADTQNQPRLFASESHPSN